MRVEEGRLEDEEWERVGVLRATGWQRMKHHSVERIFCFIPL